MSVVTRRTALSGALAIGLLSGCSGARVGPTVPVAGPAQAPPARPDPGGTRLDIGSPVAALLADAASGVLAVAACDPPRLLLYGTGDLLASPRQVTLPGRVADLTLAAPGGPLLVAVPRPAALLRVELPTGAVARTDLDGEVRSAAVAGDRAVVALGDRVAVLDGSSQVVAIVPGFAEAARVVAAGGAVAVLDRAQTSLTVIEPAAADKGLALRAGEGATTVVGDRFGRALVIDTRGGELLAFGLDPLILRQRYPVPGAPFGLAYDEQRDLAWVTLTARNEVVGYHVAGGQPVERYRFPSLHQPNSVAVDSDTGRVVVGSYTGAGVQLIDPGRVVR